MSRQKKPLDLERIRELHDRGVGMRAIAAELGVSAMTICRALEGYQSPLPLLRGVESIPEAPSSPASPEERE